MLTRLQVKNYVLIDSLDIEFPEGLIIITGQTGAGKSILIGALSLVLGSKADASAIAPGAENCVVEAQFDVDPEDPVLTELFSENDLEWDGGHIIIRRTVARSGRSRSFVNDLPVTIPVLSGMSSRLLDIHSQHQTLLLQNRTFQLDLLDRYAGNSDLLESYKATFRQLGALRGELENVRAAIAESDRNREYNEAQWQQLDGAVLKEGELEELEEEQKRLANAEEIKTLLCECLSYSEDTENGSGMSMTSSMREMRRRMEKLSRFIPSFSSLAERIDSCRLEMEDILAEVSDENESMDVSPERLQEVDDRISLLYQLMKKHACQSVSELIALRDSLSGSLADSSLLVERAALLEKEISAASAELQRRAAALSESRKKASKPFAESITSSLAFLELPQSVFRISVENAEYSLSGADSVTFLFSADGREPVDVARCASGGEMSRIMLALKDMMARLGDMPTMIFDEIDTGVSGSVADKMGSMICNMGAYMQVFAITHLPQVAAKGMAHYLVSKSVDPATGLMASRVTRLSKDERVLEIARMLSGSALTPAAIANAESLLNC